MVSKPSAFLLVRGKQKPKTKKAQHCSASVCQLLVHDVHLATYGYGDVPGVGRDLGGILRNKKLIQASV